jgi:putative hydrolase of the HAD superfamily
MNVAPREAVYVGDRQYEDVQGASRAGMRAVWLNRDRVVSDPNLPEPEYHVGSLLEIPALVDH